MNKYYLTFSYCFLLIVSVIILSCNSDTVTNNTGSNSVQASAIDSKYALDWMDIEYRIIADQHNDSPPPPSSLYCYSCITISECVAPGIPFSRSLGGQLNQMSAMPQTNASLEYDWPSVIAAAMPLVINAVYDTLY